MYEILELVPVEEKPNPHKFKFTCEGCDVKWNDYKGISLCWSCGQEFGGWML